MKLRIRTQLTVWYVVVLAIILVGLSGVLTIRLRTALVAGIDDTLDARAQTIAQGIRSPDAAELGEPTEVARLPSLDEGESIAQLVDRAGRVRQAAGERVPNSTFLTTRELARAQHRVVRTTRMLPHLGEYRVLAAPLGERGLVLVVARSLHGVHRAIRSLVLMLLVAAPVSLAAAAAGGWALARAALRPVDVMTRTAAAVDPSGPSAPLPEPDRDDELSRLARTLNQMLNRLHHALDEERRFTADASHELRTPLGIMEAELDVALRSSGTPAAAKPILESVREEVTAMARLVENLLVLSRTEAAGGVDLARRDVDLLELTHLVRQRYLQQAAERSVELSVDGASSMRWVDAELLAQAVGNLVDNAIKFATPGTNVKVVVGDGSIAVTDHGIGIPADQQGRIFDRFYRVDAARSRTTGGAGLGLAIARRIVDAHGGRIEVSSDIDDGATFTIDLHPLTPGSRPSQPPAASVGEARR